MTKLNIGDIGTIIGDISNVFKLIGDVAKYAFPGGKLATGVQINGGFPGSSTL